MTQGEVVEQNLEGPLGRGGYFARPHPPPHHEHVLSPGAADPGRRPRERGAQDRLVPLRELARDDDRPAAAEGGAHRLEGSGYPVRRLMEHERARVVRERLEPRGPRTPGRGKKAFEREPLHRQPGDRQRTQKGTRPGYRHHLHAGLRGVPHQHVPRVAHERRTRVAHQGERRPREEPSQDRRRAAAFVVLVKGFEAGRNAMVTEEPGGMPGILGDYDIDLAEDPPRPVAQVGEVPDRSGDDMKDTGARPRLSAP